MINKKRKFRIYSIILSLVLYFMFIPKAFSLKPITPSINLFSSIIPYIRDKLVSKSDIYIIGKKFNFRADLIAFRFTYKEAKLGYHKFLLPSRVKRALAFKDKHIDLLKKIEKSYSVSPELIVSILLVETRLGAYTGGYPVADTLGSLAVTHGSKQLRLICEKIKERTNSPCNLNKLKKWLKRKKIHAKRELLALFEYARKNGIDPFTIKGSWAGAIGYPQFLPSNILRYGKDGNGDGKIDLFNLKDAIESMANYLHSHGWKKGINIKAKRKVIRYYNPSTPYVNTVLALCDLLKNDGKKIER